MAEHAKVVVGISPGARYLGVVALEGDQVRFRNIVARRYAGSLHDLGERLEEALAELRPDVVVLEVPGFRRLTQENIAVERVATQVVGRLGIHTVRERLTVARKSLVGTARPTRANVHRSLAERFPRLAPSTQAKDGMRWWSDTDRYWERAFGALTLALHVARVAGPDEQTGAVAIAPEGDE